MSLDLDGKSGVVTEGTFAAGVTAVGLDMTDGNMGLVYIDTSGGDVAITAAQLNALTGVAIGDTIQLKKATADANVITFADSDGVTNAFVNRQTEFYCAKKVSATEWILV